MGMREEGCPDGWDKYLEELISSPHGPIMAGAAQHHLGRSSWGVTEHVCIPEKLSSSEAWAWATQ